LEVVPGWPAGVGGRVFRKSNNPMQRQLFGRILTVHACCSRFVQVLKGLPMTSQKSKTKRTGPRWGAAHQPILQEATGTAHSAAQMRLLNEIRSTLFLPDELSEDQKLERIAVSVVMLNGIRPQGELEGMLAVQMVAAHNAAIECLRRAMIPDQTLDGRDIQLRHAARLLSIYARQVEALDKHRGKGQQVTVKYVNVESGGQAVVGDVAVGARPGRQAANASVGESSRDDAFAAAATFARASADAKSSLDASDGSALATGKPASRLLARLAAMPMTPLTVKPPPKKRRRV